MIVLTGVTKRYGAFRALDNFSLHVPAGSSFALWGHNGAGKTTVLRSILQLVRYEGQITVAGRDVAVAGRQLRRQIGYVPQELPHWDMTVGATMEFFAALKKVPPTQINFNLARVGLAAESHKAVPALSGGMRQRLALALALLGDPPILLLDEATASLDEASRRDLLGLLAECRAEGRTILFSSHNYDEIVRLADQAAFLEHGKLIRLEVPAGNLVGGPGLLDQAGQRAGAGQTVVDWERGGAR